MKKHLLLVSFLALLLATCSDDEEEVFIEVFTAKQLSEIRNNLSGNYILMNDITLPATGSVGCAPDLEESIPDYCTSGWNPIGQADTTGNGNYKAFTGKFDGQGFVVKNLYINRSSDDPFAVGLFASNDGSIYNIKVENTNINIIGVGNASISVGILVGTNGGSIVNSHSTGKISSNCSCSSNNIGGLVGNNITRYLGSITSSSSSVDITSHYTLTEGTYSNDIGGLVGSNPSGSITSSYATGNISSTSGGTIGGLVGHNGGSITGSYTSTNLSGSSANSNDGYMAGGLTGYSYGPITTSYATGSVVINGRHNHIGGLVGGNNNAITSSYATGSVSAISTDSSFGNNTAGGLVGINYNDKTISFSYATGSVSATGGLYNNAGGLTGINESYAIITSSYKNSSATITGATIEPSGTPIASGEPMTEGNFTDTNVWKSNIAFPKLAWQQ